MNKTTLSRRDMKRLHNALTQYVVALCGALDSMPVYDDALRDETHAYMRLAKIIEDAIPKEDTAK